MVRGRDGYDWKRIHAELDRRLSSLGASFERDDARGQAILRERSMRLAIVPAERGGQGALTRFLFFRAGGGRYAMALAFLQEISRLAAVARVPGAAAGVLGVTTWRGEFVTIFDLAPILGVAAEESMHRYVMVFRGAAPRIALAIEEPERIAPLDPTLLQAPDAWQSGRPDLFHGATADAVPVFDAVRLMARFQENLQAA